MTWVETVMMIVLNVTVEDQGYGHEDMLFTLIGTTNKTRSTCYVPTMTLGPLQITF